MPRRTHAPRDVDAYLESVSDKMRPICVALRDLIRSAVPGLSETIRWGSPCFQGHGLVCGIGAFQSHVTLFFFRGAEVPDPKKILRHGEGNAAGRSAKFSNVAEIPVAGMRKVIQAAAKLDGMPKVKPKPRATRKPLPVPPPLAAALRKDRTAARFFDSLPPSAQREFNEWVGEAKREETRERRLAATLKRLRAGRRLNDEYR